MSVQVFIPAKKFQGEMLDWAKEHCSSYITNDAHVKTGNDPTWYYVFYFGSEKEALWFRIMWL